MPCALSLYNLLTIHFLNNDESSIYKHTLENHSASCINGYSCMSVKQMAPAIIATHISAYRCMPVKQVSCDHRNAYICISLYACQTNVACDHRNAIYACVSLSNLIEEECHVSRISPYSIIRVESAKQDRHHRCAFGTCELTSPKLFRCVNLSSLCKQYAAVPSMA